jgi:Tfp pilus assembly protein PilN
VAPNDDLSRRLARINPTRAFLATLLVMLIGLFLPGIVGAAVLCLLGVALIALTVTTWPVQPARTRAARLILLVVLISLVISKIL